MTRIEHVENGKVEVERRVDGWYVVFVFPPNKPIDLGPYPSWSEARIAMQGVIDDAIKVLRAQGLPVQKSAPDKNGIVKLRAGGSA